MPKTIKEALELDKKKGNTLWADTIAKEMRDVRVAFKILLDKEVCAYRLSENTLLHDL